MKKCLPGLWVLQNGKGLHVLTLFISFYKCVPMFIAVYSNFKTEIRVRRLTTTFEHLSIVPFTVSSLKHKLCPVYSVLDA
ncbi:hypothetical protein HMPREF0530_2287 [Lacticaseibacillus paracasei subsp. paracasei ATCC 25302 = DSM 5622 = JCM 8130]|nr:hypothetical protein HMPREF0530_2287 [Lacticaseibacillus paracasei subsp. paracasei ATCC 25302 = DSM 5622 = JCM 8130]